MGAVRPSTGRPVARHAQLGPEHFEVDHSLELLEVVAFLRQTSKPILE